MKHITLDLRKMLASFSAWLLFSPLGVLAFPPAPHHMIYGQVRNEMGDPLTLDNAQVIFESIEGSIFQTGFARTLEPGVNYRLRLPMDSAIKLDPYKPNALKTSIAFRIRVMIGNVSYLPLEMAGDFSNLGEPAESTRLDLTLGEDADGDGLPDAWERAVIAALGGDKTLDDITGEDDSDGDGLSNLQEYRAGTYAYDDSDGIQLSVVGLSEEAAELEFLAIRGRNYSIWTSSDFRDWTQAEFRITNEGTQATRRISYEAEKVHTVKVEVLIPEQNNSLLYFKALVR